MRFDPGSPKRAAGANGEALPRWFDHWHPVARSRELGRKPIARPVLDREIVLFKGDDGRIGAMPNRCPHRGMRLSQGCVSGSRLVCPYHGWSYDANGLAASPGNPALRLTVPTFDAIDRHGLVWIKARGSEDVLPHWERDGYEFVHSGSWQVKGSVEVMLDNFTEVEHTATAHWYFGYDPDHVAEISNKTQSTSDMVEVRTEGVQKKLPWPMRAFFGTRLGDLLWCEWRTEFAPLRCTWHWGWKDRQTSTHRDGQFCAVAYFNPIGVDACQLSTIYFWKWKQGAASLLSRLALPLLRIGINNEIKIDIGLVENVTQQPTERTSHLGRFDKALVEQRRRLAQDV
jgi:vanillate O-demethylase monooxygenase subunit